MANIDNCDDIIDSRDVIERIEELENEVDSFEDDISTAEEEITDANTAIEDLESEQADLDEDERDEFARLEGEIDEQRSTITGLRDDIVMHEGSRDDAKEELQPFKELAEEAEGYCSWNSGEALIRDSYFMDYCRDLVSDIGDLPADLPGYIENNIDWEGVADDLKMDYTEVDFDGVTYYVRMC
jgi:chromosome segregation ATPase